MTTTPAFPALPAHCRADFAVGAGFPSPRLWLSDTEQYLHEDFFVEALRQYVSAIAQRCQHDSPAEYEDFINDLTEVDGGDAPTFNDVRFAYLLHSYADYMPSPECEYLDADLDGCQVWLSPTGAVVIDLVTTLALTELAPDADQCTVMRALRVGEHAFGSNLIGVRHIVLDAAHESSLYRPNGGGEPLLTSALNSSAWGVEA